MDESHTRDHTGTGLGLAIVKSIMESHKGYYKALTKEDHFILELKLMTGQN
jgi:signal transduction histidine kinase